MLIWKTITYPENMIYVIFKNMWNAHFLKQITNPGQLNFYMCFIPIAWVGKGQSAKLQATSLIENSIVTGQDVLVVSVRT